jgi:hypothetical protein
VDSLELEVEQAIRAERDRLLLESYQEGQVFELEEYTAPNSGDKDDRWVVDPDGILLDIEKMDKITHCTHPRSHVDWRTVWMMRLGNNWITPSTYQKNWYSWDDLALPLDVPGEWLRTHCNEKMEVAVEENNGFDFNLEHEEFNPLKGRAILPVHLQR